AVRSDASVPTVTCRSTSCASSWSTRTLRPRSPAASLGAAALACACGRGAWAASGALRTRTAPRARNARDEAGPYLRARTARLRARGAALPAMGVLTGEVATGLGRLRSFFSTTPPTEQGIPHAIRGAAPLVAVNFAVLRRKLAAWALVELKALSAAPQGLKSALRRGC